MWGLSRVMEEPPFRLLSYFFLKRFAKSVDTIDRWGTVDRPHYFAGELLAIDEFNQANPLLKIDRWRGVRKDRIFVTQSWLERMYVAHDLAAVDESSLARAASNACSLDEVSA